MVHVKVVIANPNNMTVQSVGQQSYITTSSISYAGHKTENISEYYNTIFLESPRADLYCFLTGDDKFTTTDSIKCIVDLFRTNIQQNGLIYSDKYLQRDNILVPQIYPPYNSTDKTIYNPTIFVNGHIDSPIFDPMLSGLRSYDVIRKIGTAARVLHIPKFLITSKLTVTDIKKEIDYYVGKSN